MNRHGCIRPTLGAACAALQQSGQDLFGNLGAGHEAAHVAAFGDHPVHRPPLRGAERMVDHARQLVGGTIVV